MTARGKIRFLLGDSPIELSDVDPNRTLLEFLRGQGRVGTKEGCAEGDCGACTVAIGEMFGDELRYRAVNACIILLGMADGKQVVTIEDLSARNGPLHPIQQAMVDENATQCGFCTPGFVMSIFAPYANRMDGSAVKLNDLLAGNLCRCTGYGPILAAANKALARQSAVADDEGTVALKEQLIAWRGEESLQFEAGGKLYFSPRGMEELLHLLKRYPNALLTAGMTDVGLWITKQHRRFDRIISLCEVAELRDISEKDGWLEIGAAVTYSEAFDTISGYWPDFGELLRRLGSVQIRNCGTIGGNVANGSPIGDSPPPLIALGAEVCLRSLRGERILPLEDFFVEYGKQDLRKGEILAQVRVPLPKTRDTFRCYKLSKRFDQDISALCGAYRFRLGRDGIARDVRIAYGGMAGVPQRALKAETAIEGNPWTEGTLRDAIAAVAEDFSPLSDWRASAGYRQRAAANLLKRFYLETSGEAKLTRVLDSEVLAHG